MTIRQIASRTVAIGLLLLILSTIPFLWQVGRNYMITEEAAAELGVEMEKFFLAQRLSQTLEQARLMNGGEPLMLTIHRDFPCYEITELKIRAYLPELAATGTPTVSQLRGNLQTNQHIAEEYVKMMVRIDRIEVRFSTTDLIMTNACIDGSLLSTWCAKRAQRKLVESFREFDNELVKHGVKHDVVTKQGQRPSYCYTTPDISPDAIRP